MQIQQVEYRLTTNVAISHHRLPLLHRLAKKSHGDDSIGQSVFSRLEIQPDEAIDSSPNSSDLRSVRVNILCKTHADTREIERVLNQLTTASEESAECIVFEKQILKERWLLQSNSHSIKRLEMDQERDKFAMEEEPKETEMAASATDREPARRSLFRLTSYGNGQHDLAPESGLMDSLLQLNQNRTDNLESMTQTLKKLQEKSRGFLSLTGSPRMEPVVKSLTSFRLLVLSVLCFFVWILLMGWLQPIRESIALLIRMRPDQQMELKSNVHGTADGIESPKRAASSNSLGIAKTLHWMQHEGIPYLGAIQIAVGESKERELSSLSVNGGELSNRETPEFKALVVGSKSADAEQTLRLLKRLSDGSLVLWVGLFGLRLLFDPLWRELVMVAPLAALSRIISGIQ